MKTYNNNFLSLLDNVRVKKTYAKITILDFVKEKPISAVEGVFTTGSMSVNGSSAVRRTVSFSMRADDKTYEITNLDNLISMNKKINVEMGVSNPLVKYKEEYGDIIWFPLGVYIISSATLSRNTSGITINIQGKDKMAQLDGTVGGTLPASVTFHERQEIISNKFSEEDEIRVSYPTIFQIIQESVHHYGGQPADKIIINDIDLTAKMLVKYMGEYPLWMNPTNTAFVIGNRNPGGWTKYSPEQDVGYMTTSFTYPGDLVLSAGETVASLLDKISKTLGNHEYFYDVYGNFIFQEKRNYLNSSYTPIKELNGDIYFTSFNQGAPAYYFEDDETVVSYANNPKFDNIKNDFVVWGQRTTGAGTQTAICYHLAIDEKPFADTILSPMIRTEDGKYELCSDSVYMHTEAKRQIGPALPNGDWREELYRNALLASNTGGTHSSYDMELIAFWRTLYDPTNIEWESSNWWNPAVENDPGQLIYWLDFLDSPDLGKYSVNQIGRRTKAVNDTNITKLYNTDYPDVMLLNKTSYEADDMEYVTGYNWEELLKHYDERGQRYMLVNDSNIKNFGMSASGATAYDTIRTLIYQHLVYNTQITITCSPRYYMEPNNLIRVYDKKSGISGNFIISQFSLPLAYNGTMSITATEALTRI